jgi:hypothetical protein
MTGPGVVLRSMALWLWLALTVIPMALGLVVASVFVSGARLYWMAVGCSRLAVWGARHICGVDTDAPILPIAVTSGRCWGKTGWLIHPGVIGVSVGACVPVTGRDPKAVMADVEAWIEAEMRRLDPTASPHADSQASTPHTSRQPRWAPGGSGA